MQKNAAVSVDGADVIEFCLSTGQCAKEDEIQDKIETSNAESLEFWREVYPKLKENITALDNMIVDLEQKVLAKVQDLKSALIKELHLKKEEAGKPKMQEEHNASLSRRLEDDASKLEKDIAALDNDIRAISLKQRNNVKFPMVNKIALEQGLLLVVDQKDKLEKIKCEQDNVRLRNDVKEMIRLRRLRKLENSPIVSTKTSLEDCRAKNGEATFSHLQKGAWIAMNSDEKWTAFCVEKIVLKIYERIEESCDDKPYNFHYVLRSFNNETKLMSFKEADEKLASDEVRPIVSSSNDRMSPPVWVEGRWENTSSLPLKMADDCVNMVLAHTEKLKESTAFVTVSNKCALTLPSVQCSYDMCSALFFFTKGCHHR